MIFYKVRRSISALLAVTIYTTSLAQTAAPPPASKEGPKALIYNPFPPGLGGDLPKAYHTATWDVTTLPATKDINILSEPNEDLKDHYYFIYKAPCWSYSPQTSAYRISNKSEFDVNPITNFYKPGPSATNKQDQYATPTLGTETKLVSPVWSQAVVPFVDSVAVLDKKCAADSNDPNLRPKYQHSRDVWPKGTNNTTKVYLVAIIGVARDSKGDLTSRFLPTESNDPKRLDSNAKPAEATPKIPTGSPVGNPIYKCENTGVQIKTQTIAKTLQLEEKSEVQNKEGWLNVLNGSVALEGGYGGGPLPGPSGKVTVTVGYAHTWSGDLTKVSATNRVEINATTDSIAAWSGPGIYTQMGITPETMDIARVQDAIFVYAYDVPLGEQFAKGSIFDPDIGYYKWRTNFDYDSWSWIVGGGYGNWYPSGSRGYPQNAYEMLYNPYYQMAIRAANLDGWGRMSNIQHPNNDTWREITLNKGLNKIWMGNNLPGGYWNTLRDVHGSALRYTTATGYNKWAFFYDMVNKSMENNHRKKGFEIDFLADPKAAMRVDGRITSVDALQMHMVSYSTGTQDFFVPKRTGDQLLSVISNSPMPPADYAVKCAGDLSAGKLAEVQKENYCTSNGGNLPCSESTFRVNVTEDLHTWRDPKWKNADGTGDLCMKQVTWDSSFKDSISLVRSFPCAFKWPNFNDKFYFKRQAINSSTILPSTKQIAGKIYSGSQSKEVCLTFYRAGETDPSIPDSVANDRFVMQQCNSQNPNQIFRVTNSKEIVLASDPSIVLKGRSASNGWNIGANEQGQPASAIWIFN